MHTFGADVLLSLCAKGGAVVARGTGCGALRRTGEGDGARPILEGDASTPAL